MKKAQIHIEKLHRKKAKNDDNSSTLAQKLRCDIFTAFKGEHKFIFELLQNADDSAPTDRTIETSFVFKKSLDGQSDYLVFSHSGTHFSEQDVEKLCNYSQQHVKDKSSDSKKIGYKGVGFKSVFSIADCVHVISGDYDFRFDEGYFKEKQLEDKSEGEYPWPIIPIFNTEANRPLDIESLINTKHVTFVMKIRSGIEIEKEIAFIIANPRIFLFLKNIRVIDLVCSEKTKRIEIKKEQEKVITVVIDGSVYERWLMFNFCFDVPQETTEFLHTLQDVECPQRLKEAKKTTVTFLAQIDRNGKLAVGKNNVLFSYLPTQINFGFPFLINADFLLNPERSSLKVENNWNQFLMKKIGFHHLECLAEIAHMQENRSEVFRLLPKTDILKSDDALLQSYQDGFNDGAREIAFIPSIDGTVYLKAKGSVVDETGFYSQLANATSFKTPFDSQLLVPNTQLEMERFKKIFEETIIIVDFPYLLEKIGKLKKTDILYQRHVLNFIQQAKDKDFLEGVKKKKLFFSSHGEDKLYSSEELYLPLEESISGLDVSEYKDINFVHCDLLEFKAGLGAIGVSGFSLIKFIRGPIKRLIAENKISLGNVIPITHVVYLEFLSQKKELQANDWEYLKNMPLKTKKGSLKIFSQCYLSDQYSPKFLLEACSPNLDIYPSDEYLSRESVSVQMMKKLFQQMDIHLSIEVKTYGFYRKLSVLYKPYMSDYLTYLQEEEKTPSKQMIQADLMTHYISNFVEIYLLEFISMREIANIIWPKLLEKWSLIKTTKSTYTMSRTKKDIQMSYLGYCFKYKLKIPSRDGVFRLSSELFMPSLYEVVGDFLPVADIGEQQLTEEQAVFFGFKSTIFIDDCLVILEKINNSAEKNNPARYVPVLRYLLNLKPNEDDRKKLKKWKGCLLTQNNQLKMIDQLQYCDHIDVDFSGEKWLKKFPEMSLEDMKKIAELFGVCLVSGASVRINLSGEMPEYASLAKDIIFRRLPVLSIIESRERAISSKDIFTKLSSKVRSSIFISATRMSLTTGDSFSDKVVSVYFYGNTFYFEKKYDSAKIRNEFCINIGKMFGLTDRSVKELHRYFYMTDPELDDYLADEKISPDEISDLASFADVEDKSATLDPQVIAKMASASIQPSDMQSSSDEDDAMLYEEEEKATGTNSIVLKSPSEHRKSSSSVTPEKLCSTPQQPSLTSSVQKRSPVDTKPSFLDLKVEGLMFSKFEGSNTTDLLNKKPVEKKGLVTFSDQDEVSSLSRDNRLTIGRRGEKVVYLALFNHYKKKYKVEPQECDTGFQLEATSEVELQVVWHNKGRPDTEDSGLSEDLTIHKKTAQGKKTRHVEVKTTLSEQQNTFKMTAGEWELMDRCTSPVEQYWMFRVSNAEKSEPEIVKIKNLKKDIKDGRIVIGARELKIK